MFNYSCNHWVDPMELDYQKANDILQGRNKTSKKLEYETRLSRKGDDIVITLWETDIITYKKNGKVVLNSGEWFTQLTKGRINKYSPVNITQKKSVWYLEDGSLFYDNMVIKDGSPVKPKYQNKTKDKLKKQINNYCKILKGMEKLPVPSQGDCWYCLMFDHDLKDGEQSTTKDHLLSHLKEKYVHGSLIMNALKSSGYGSPGVVFQMDIRDSIVNSVRRYFKKGLGIPC